MLTVDAGSLCDTSVLQSLAMWPVPPQRLQTIVCVIFGLSGQFQVRCAVDPQLLHRGPPSSRNVPFSSASSRSCCFRRSFWCSGTSMPSIRIRLIFWGKNGDVKQFKSSQSRSINTWVRTKLINQSINPSTDKSSSNSINQSMIRKPIKIQRGQEFPTLSTAPLTASGDWPVM